MVLRLRKLGADGVGIGERPCWVRDSQRKGVRSRPQPCLSRSQFRVDESFKTPSPRPPP